MKRALQIAVAAGGIVPQGHESRLTGMGEMRL